MKSVLRQSSFSINLGFNIFRKKWEWEKISKKDFPNFKNLTLTDKKELERILTNILLNSKKEVLDIDSKNDLTKVNNDTDFKKLIDNLYVNVNSKTLDKDINVKNVYKEIYQNLELIKTQIKSSDMPTKNEVLNKIDTIQNNIKFINEVNSNTSYIQIPLKMWDNTTTGELYVLKKNKKKKAIDADNATVFLSLNTQNLGQVDFLIGFKNKNINLNLRLENSKIIDFIKANYKELHERLENKGYKLVNIKYKLIDENINLLNADEYAIKEEKNTSIDYKI